MQTYPGSIARHDYSLKVWLRSFLLVGSGLLGAMAIFLVYFLSYRLTSGSSFVLMLPLAGIAAYLALVGLRSRVTIEGSRITVCNGFITRSADLANIEGFRSFTGRNGSFTRFYLKEGRFGITMSSSFETDNEFRAWMSQITDLDRRDRDHLLAEISQQQELGDTPEERLAALTTAKKTNIVVIVVAIAGAFFLNVGNVSAIEVPSAILLALVPIGVAMLMSRAPLLYVIFKRKSDPRAEISFPLIAAGLGFVFRNRGVHVVSMKPLQVLIVVVAIVYFATFFRYMLDSSSRFGAFIGMLFFVLPYSFAMPITVDTLDDHSPTTTFTAPVVRKHVTSGKSTSYYLDLGPWGPVARKNSLSVSKSTYNAFSVGDQVCLGLHGGRLHAAWYAQITCAVSPDTVP